MKLKSSIGKQAKIFVHIATSITSNIVPLLQCLSLLLPLSYPHPTILRLPYLELFLPRICLVLPSLRPEENGRHGEHRDDCEHLTRWSIVITREGYGRYHQATVDIRVLQNVRD